LLNFGLILTKINVLNPSLPYGFTPVRLDLNQKGIDQFVKGLLYIESFVEPELRIQVEGTTVFIFANQEAIKPMYENLVKIGKVEVKSSYLFTSGGILAQTIDELKTALDNWDVVFGSQDTRQAYVEEIIR